ncbi:hypothetical protein DFH29DRAFT_905086, partial [Suillus ampliporus]
RAAVAAVKAWTHAGRPTHRIVFNVASYGHSFSVPPSGAFASRTKTLTAFPTFNVSNRPLGDTWDDDGGVDVCGVYEDPGGTFNFWGLIDSGFLAAKATPAEGIYYRYDECSQTVNGVLHPEGRLLISLLYSRMCTIRPHML